MLSVVVSATCVAGFWWLRRAPRLPAAIDASPGAANGFNVLLVTLDTVRADGVGCYGGDAAATPELDRLGRRGVRFDHVSASTPMTLPSHATIHTGLDPPRHGVRDNGLFRLTDAHRTLAEHLKAAGYATAAFVGSFVLDARYGLSQGFDVYDDDLHDSRRTSGVRQGEPQRPGNVVVDAALDWLETQRGRGDERPFFCWVHLYDAHTPYLPPEPYATRYRENPYLGEIAFADEQLGRLTSWLDAHALFDKTVVVAVADHGESLGEHFEPTHSLFLYESTMAVPMIWSCPPVIPEGSVVSDRIVGIVDVMPTMLDLLGLDDGQDAPEDRGEPDGVSLLRGGTPADRAVYIETLMPQTRHGWSPLFGLRRLGDKYIEAPTPEYYDLMRDPKELHNAYSSGASAKDLQTRLAERMATHGPGDDAGDGAVTPDAEALKKLAALGYVLSGGDAMGGPRGDPKDMVRSYEAYQRAVDLIAVGGFAEAGEMLRDVVTQSPENGSAWASLGLALAGAGRVEEALPAVRRAVELQPRERHWVYLARLQMMAGDEAGFDESLRRLASLDPDDGEVAILRGEREMARKHYDAALAQFAEARRRDPSRQSTSAYAWAGKAMLAMGNRAGALDAFKAALSCDPMDTAAVEAMVGLEEQAGDFAAAAEFARRLCDRRPLVMRHATKLAELCIRLNRPDEAVSALEAMVVKRPDDRTSHANLGKLLVDLGRYDEAVAPLRRALALSQSYAFAKTQLGRALLGQGDLSGAVRLFREVLARLPTDRAALHGLIRSLTAGGRVDEALDALERAGPAGVDFSALARDPGMQGLVSDPRFQSLRRRFDGR